MRRLDLRNLQPAAEDLQRAYGAAVPRAEVDVEHAMAAVRPICEDVRARGADAVLDAGERFDGVRPAQLRVPVAAITDALAALAPDIRAGLEESIRRLRQTCLAELEHTLVTDVAPGATVERRIVPMQRVGLYVPGGLAPLVSTVIMNAVPAQIAGVPGIALASPPNVEFGGLPHPTILAACGLLGIDEVYSVGGAQALAMFAYGAGECRPVNLITGPGNIYVAAAKRYLQGTVSIDSEAGPTEIAIIADATADAGFVAADLISQAEHDPMAASVLITDSQALVDAVDAALDEQIGSASMPSASAPRWRVSSPRRSWSGTWTRPSSSPTDTAPSTWRSRPRTRPGSPPGSSMPARSSSAPTRPCRSVTTQRVPTTSCPRPGAPATPRDSPSGRSARTCTS